MGQYSEEWWFSNGNLATNQRAAVFEEDQNTLASIYSDAGLTVPLANPTTTNASGVLTFYAADGSYWIFVGKVGAGDSVLATIGASPDNPVLSVNGELPDGGGNVTISAVDVGAQPIATIDALGDLYVGTGPDATTRLPRGADGEVLASNSGEPTGLEWVAAPGGAVDSVNGETGVVVLDAGDVGADPAGAAAAAQAAAIAASDPVGSAAAAAAASQPLATINAKGDLYAGTADNTTTRQGVGADGTVLTANSATSTGLAWTTPTPAPVTSVNGDVGVVVLDAADVGAVETTATPDQLYGTDDAGAATTYNVEALTQRTLTVFSDDRNVLTTGNGDARFYNREGIDLVIVGVWVSAGVQPTGAAILVDVNLNGSTIYSTQANRPTVPAASNGGGISATPNTTAFEQGDYLTVDIDQIGATIPGGRITVGIVVHQDL